jgi:hypothetical protein
VGLSRDELGPEAPLKLVLLENPGHGGTLNHLGVEVATTDTVRAEITRLTVCGLFPAESSLR